ncbi:hypothetical protein C900_00378 [Fulvivirga imtechensis AK7]|uniref:Uncharacterized protein n=1 Tax=Fulvivirga imtechensis AK7 TaxID=1237149 RepID=L8JM39_9BACT|nr:hypothetical protein [Fulvivirga imtechensis]ELR68457.1 hypothetical protein C900_00378 [Fulvivirga imtechensis AK7]
MEFDEIKNIWNKQNNEMMYTINEEVLRQRITAKKRTTSHIVDFSEKLLIIVNIGAAGFVLGLGIVKASGNVFTYTLAALMFFTAGYVLVKRLQRKRWENRFDLSLLGDLNHAIANASYQVKLSQVMIWYAAPVAILTALNLGYNGKEMWIVLLIIGFFVLAFLASRMEHGIYVNNKRKLEELRNVLEDNASNR